MTERRDSAPGAPPPFGGEPAASRPKLAGLLPNAGPSRRVPTAFAMALAITLVCGAAYLAYAAARAWVQERPEYLLDPGRIELQPEPPHALRGGREAILKSVIDAGGLSDPIRLLRPDFDAIRRAFALHSPWIARVDKIDASQPGRLIVRVAYRHPVAKVTLNGRRGPGLVLAGDGAVLPATDLDPKDLQQLPILTGLRPMTETEPGLVLGADRAGRLDPGLAGALRVAEAVREYPLGILSVHVRTPEAGPPVYTLRTRRMLWVEWQHAPGEEIAGEPPAAVKLERLARWEEQRGDEASGEDDILRFLRDGVVLLHGTRPTSDRAEDSTRFREGGRAGCPVRVGTARALTAGRVREVSRHDHT